MGSTPHTLLNPCLCRSRPHALLRSRTSFDKGLSAREAAAFDDARAKWQNRCQRQVDRVSPGTLRYDIPSRAKTGIFTPSRINPNTT